MSSNRREQGQEHANAVTCWIAERDFKNDFHEYERSGKINRKALCSELQFSRSVTTQNPAVKSALDEAEARWFAAHKQQSAKAHEAARDRSERHAADQSSRNSKLEDELARCKAEITALKRQLERYAAMDAVLQQTGLVPR